MSFYVKSIMALIFLAAGIIAVLCMLALMGKSERRLSGTFLRRTHRTAGIIFFVLTVFISYVCIKFVAEFGGALSVRAVFHAVLALALFIVLLLKVLIVRFYRELIRIVPTMGLIVFVLAFLVVGTSAGHFFLKYGRTGSAAEQDSAQVETAEAGKEAATKGDASKGSAVFENNCAFCHYSDRTEGKLGPGLAGVLTGDKLPSSGRPATAANVISQLEEPIGTMPSFTSLSEQEVADLIAYLVTI
jgi:cytochrome c2